MKKTVVTDPLSAVSTPGQVRMIALADLRVAEWNARKTFDLAVLAKFTESIEQHGVQVPLVVRPLPMSEWHTLADSDDIGDGKEIYEIVAGHRRFKAASDLELAELPCIVRELDDVAAREVALIDNLQRENLPPLEEADGFADLMDQLGSIAAVAARVGKEQSYVAKSLKLRTLTTWSRDALREKLITIDHALLLARLAEAEQNEALKWCLDRNAGVKVSVEAIIADRIKRKGDSGDDDDLDPEDVDPDNDVLDESEAGAPAPARRRNIWNRLWEPESVQRLKEHIECESGVPLDRAPWPMGEDYLLPDAGSCLDCPKNTKANAPLFGDLDMGVAVCTDGACFKAKTITFVQIQGREEAIRAALEAGKPPVPGAFEPLRVSWKATSTVPRQLKDGGGVNPAQIFKDGQWEEATKKCEHTRAAVTVDWSDANNRGFTGDDDKLRRPGEIVQACIQPKCKAHPKAYEKAARANTSSGSRNENSADARADQERRVAAAEAENQIRATLVASVIAGVKKLSGDLLRGLIMLALPSYLGAEDKKRFPGLENTLKTFPVDSPLFARAAVSLFFVRDDRDFFLDEWCSDITAGRRELLKLAGTMGWTGADPWAKPRPEAKAAAKPAKKAAAKKTPAKKAAAKKKGGR